MKPAQPAPQPAATEVDVVVVGCGPVGALTANLLGLRGVSTLVVERSTTPHGQPRAFSCDDEALRIYQQVGLLDRIGADLHQPARADYVNAAGKTFATIDFSQVDFGFGHAPLNFFDQPRLEQVLRGGLDRYDHVELRLGTELVSLYQDDDRVHLVLRDVATGQSYPVQVRYVLGCDGARSTTRTAVRIPLAGASYAEPWLAVSGDVPAEAIRAPHTTFVCDWRRPAFVSPGARGSYRAEFMLQPDETEADMTRPERIAELVEPYVDPDRFTVTRAVIYTFHHLIAQRWREGRVFLLGDAAHQMPPFLGQGLCSGLRDATNLTWKLALVLGRDADPALLDTYETERRGHTAAMADTSVRLGRVFLARSRPAAWLRDTTLRAVQTVPRVRRFVRRFEFKPLPAYDRGLFAGGRRHGAVGTMFPQPRVTVAGSADPVLLDEVLGAGFALLGTAVPAGRSGWPGVPVRTVVVHPAGSTGLAATCAEPDDGQVHVVDVDGVIVSWLRRHRCDAVVLRPDRFVYALGSAADDTLLPSLAAALGTPGTVAATWST
ncbi:bifunctional 3-(3-hydroxy-phenyl)propionate/3-hydroxycinnamic acid hydroxylase [Micromonospora maris]|uniref:bifunctional 3-(3-hydroxy-phenyl)propionate/3-hydroxycinnamic acid hydroxylase n=1 Tax=Micromonospora maris TaxID=1003110 RepID=UPI002E0D6655|nr:bifunctional 3-(3-hydroxy-phenyl)propionate/3-hydroxycinnamic acid hydroxylase [Micromonospora maris]WSK40203.1 bifunctional 3-(3-hydroxy-phenyl)propionate/3-hydroxycinnamic acid hydroxylase [Micromonospora maris]